MLSAKIARSDCFRERHFHHYLREKGELLSKAVAPQVGSSFSGRELWCTPILQFGFFFQGLLNLMDMGSLHPQNTGRIDFANQFRYWGLQRPCMIWTLFGPFLGSLGHRNVFRSCTVHASFSFWTVLQSLCDLYFWDARNQPNQPRGVVSPFIFHWNTPAEMRTCLSKVSNCTTIAGWRNACVRLTWSLSINKVRYLSNNK